jgi:oligopeptide/dipeptide ABC transporter ATP-binding protein
MMAAAPVPVTGTGLALEIRGLRVTARGGGQSVQILRGLDLDLRSGEILGVVGESGSGKSTLCRAIARLLPGGLAVDAGTIRMGDVDVLGIRPGQLHRMPSGGVRMVFQNPMTALNPVMTVGDQCTEAARAVRRLSRAAALARSVEILERMGIKNAASRMNDYPYQFSGGQRQRIVVSIALAGDPAVLLADEPTSALDVSTQAALLDLIKEVCAERQTAVIFVSHNYAVVSQLCSRVLVLYAGQAMELGPSRALLTQSRHPYTAALIASLPSIEHRVPRLPAIPGQPPAVGEAPGGCPFRPRCRYCDDGCAAAPMDMREAAPGHQTSCIRASVIWPARGGGGRGGDGRGDGGGTGPERGQEGTR